MRWWDAQWLGPSSGKRQRTSTRWLQFSFEQMKIPSIKLSLAILAVGACSATVAVRPPPGELFYWSYDRVDPVGQDAKRLIPQMAFKASRLSNIVDVEASEGQILIVAADEEAKRSFGLAAFVLRRDRDSAPVSIRRPGLVRASLSPDGKMVALGVCSANGCHLEVMDVDAPSAEVLRVTLSDRITSLAWNPREPKIAYVTGGNVVHVVDLTGANKAQVNGNEIGWSSSGEKLVIAREGDLITYDIRTGAENSLLRRAFWKSRIVGRIGWSRSGIVAFNTPAGIDGNKVECNLYDVATGVARSEEAGFSFCGIVR